MEKLITIENQKMLLSSEMSIFKTERFIYETKRIRDIDSFLFRLCHGILLCNIEDNDNSSAYILQTEEGLHSFFFTFRLQQGKKDAVFFRYATKDSFQKRYDTSLGVYLRQKSFKLCVKKIKIERDACDFDKLYRLTNTHVNFPLLNATQKQIVTLENQNVLVYGVAGSGKTNICIEKIIFTACRGYHGRILYTTFSRGLLIETAARIDEYKEELKRFATAMEDGQVQFLDDNHKKAIENRLGIYFSAEDDDRILAKIKDIIRFLQNNVDFFLIEDLYSKHIGTQKSFCDENHFLKVYVKDIKNHQLASKLQRVEYLSYEVVYKEIYGVIFGCFENNKNKDMLTLQEYIEKRKDSFTKPECEIIFLVAKDYKEYLDKNNLTDDNGLSRELLDVLCDKKLYSLAIVDEVQDMTEVNLYLLKSISHKMLCVGDALQMINPSYFSFSYLKRLLYDKDIVTVKELQSNYRNSQKIAEIINRLGQINTKQFGVHSFVVKGSSIYSGVKTSTVFVKGDGLMDRLFEQAFSNYTIIVGDMEEKQLLRQFLSRPEILTVSEIKGLERDTVILYNILSDNLDKWKTLERLRVNRKDADENSVYRYYFNLFYVAISRGKSHVYVIEEKPPAQFQQFFGQSFEEKNVDAALKDLLATSNKLELEQDEILARIAEFVRLSQYDNARFNCGLLLNEREQEEELVKIDIHQQYIRHGKYREAGIRFWEAGMLMEARSQFQLAKDEALISFIDAYLQNDGGGLGIEVVDFLPNVEQNETAKNLIFETIKKDIAKMKNKNNQIKEALKRIGGRKNG